MIRDGRPRDWFDFAPAADRIATAELAMRGPRDNDAAEHMAPDAKPDQVRRHAAKLRKDKLFAEPCPRGLYVMWSEPPRPVTDRLPIWC